MQVSWAIIKDVCTSRNLSVQWIDLVDSYELRLYDGHFGLGCNLPKDGSADVLDFEANFKDSGNKSPAATVTTQFEKRDKTLKIAHGEADVDTETGLATILIRVPGTPGGADGRWMSGGIAFFSSHNTGDKVLSVRFTDEDNLLGAGAGYVVGSYTDDEADEANQGWVISPRAWVEAEAIGGYGFAPSGFYIKVVGKKAPGNYSGKFFMNIEWGKPD